MRRSACHVRPMTFFDIAAALHALKIIGRCTSGAAGTSGSPAAGHLFPSCVSVGSNLPDQISSHFLASSMSRNTLTTKGTSIGSEENAYILARPKARSEGATIAVFPRILDSGI